jgi:hypothetical protein
LNSGDVNRRPFGYQEVSTLLSAADEALVPGT